MGSAIIDVAMGVYDLLNEIPLLKNKVFPLATTKEISTPYAQYRRVSTYFNYSIDGISSAELDYEIIIADNNYSRSLEIANNLIATLNEIQNKRWKSIEIIGLSEAADSDFYTQLINLKIYI